MVIVLQFQDLQIIQEEKNKLHKEKFHLIKKEFLFHQEEENVSDMIINLLLEQLIK